MGIPATTPRVTAATEEKTFDTVWLKSFAVQADNPNAPCRVIALVDLCRYLADGTIELLGDPRSIAIDDFWAECEKDPELLQLMGAIVTKIKAIAGV